MKKIAWATDLHLNFLEQDHLENVINQFANLPVDGYLLTGDISEAPVLEAHLKQFESTVKRPIYFVLGNHDVWHSSFQKVHSEIASLSLKNENLNWLQSSDPIFITDKTAIVGADGWYDGGYGDWRHSGIQMNDWWRVEEFHEFIATSNLQGIMSFCAKIANDCAISASSKLKNAFSRVDHCLFATHIPPWLQISRYRGRETDIHAQPYYISKCMGDMLVNTMGDLQKSKKLEVFAGHTHFEGSAQINSQIFARVGGAEYYKPTLVDIIEVE